MKIYCHPVDVLDIQDGIPTECREIALQGSPELLRDIAKFLVEAAERIERGSMKEPSDHFHWQDESTAWIDSYPDIVVVEPITNKAQ